MDSLSPLIPERAVACSAQSDGSSLVPPTTQKSSLKRTHSRPFKRAPPTAPRASPLSTRAHQASSLPLHALAQTQECLPVDDSKDDAGSVAAEDLYALLVSARDSLGLVSDAIEDAMGRLEVDGDTRPPSVAGSEEDMDDDIQDA